MEKWDRSKGAPEPIRALNRIPERECGEKLVALAEYAPSVRLIRPGMIPLCRLTVARMAQSAAERLPQGVYLGVIDAWRPLSRQQRIHDWMVRCATEAFPNLPHAQIMRKANRWAAPTTHKAPPGHCTGAALDVWLVDEAGNQLDVTSPFDRFSSSATYTFGLSEEAHRNRMMLVETMLEVGFSNCRDEWWHYSYGDAGWAVRLGKPEAIYGLIEVDMTPYEFEEALWQEAHDRRHNPFLAG